MPGIRLSQRKGGKFFKIKNFAPCWDTKKKFIWLGWAIASLATVPGGTFKLKQWNNNAAEKFTASLCLRLDFDAMCIVQCACAGSFPFPLPLPLSSFPLPLSSFPLEAETTEVNRSHRLCYEKSEESALPPPFSAPCSIQRRVWCLFLGQKNGIKGCNFFHL